MSSSGSNAGGKRRLDPSFVFRLAYFAGNAIILAVVYNITTSGLFEERGRRVPVVEAWLWLFVLASWVTYLTVQGSKPGYVDPLAAPPPSAAAGASRGDSATLSSDTLASVPAGASDTHQLGSPDRPAPSSPGLAAEHVTLHHEGAEERDDSDRQHLRPDRTAVAVAEYDRAQSKWADADPDYYPEAEADPISAMEAAAVQARAGVRECRTCHCRQPARAHHCRVCDKCVHTFDHHCGVIGTCIGERNRCRFWWFLLAQSSALTYVIGLLNTSFVWRRTSGEWMSENALALITLLVLWILQIVVFPLFCFHTWLALTNTTTFETVTGSRRLWYLAGTNPKECDLPYSRGLCGNLRMFCCALDTWRWACLTARAVAVRWQPRQWQYPGVIERDTEDVCSNLWSNRYWSCC